MRNRRPYRQPQSQTHVSALNYGALENVVPTSSLNIDFDSDFSDVDVSEDAAAAALGVDAHELHADIREVEQQRHPEASDQDEDPGAITAAAEELHDRLARQS